MPALSALMLALAVGYTVPHPSCGVCQVQWLQSAELLVEELQQLPCVTCDCKLHGWRTQCAKHLCSAVPREGLPDAAGPIQQNKT